MGGEGLPWAKILATASSSIQLYTSLYARSDVHSSGVTTRGEVRQLPQGAKRQGALGGAFGRRIVCFAHRIQPNF